MKGKILTWTGEKGIISFQGQRFNFTIDNWSSDVAPKPDMQVKVSIVNNELVDAQVVSEQEIISEQVEKLKNSGSTVLTGLSAEIGKGTVISYVVFTIGAFFFNTYSGTGMLSSLSVNLPKSFGPLRAFETSGLGILLTFIGIASISIPFFWKTRRAYLAWTLPLSITVIGMINFYTTYKSTLGSISSATSSFLGNDIGKQVSDMASEMGSLYPGMGAVLCLGAGAVLWAQGVGRYKKNVAQ